MSNAVIGCSIGAIWLSLTCLVPLLIVTQAPIFVRLAKA